MAEKVAKVFALTIPSALEEMERVRAFVEDATRRSGFDEELSHWIDLSVNESAINAIVHGNRQDPGKTVFLQITTNDHAIEIIIEDEGAGFEMCDVPDPTNIENILRPSGRGILIIRSFMDEVDLSKSHSGGCRLRMFKRIGDQDPL